MGVAAAAVGNIWMLIWHPYKDQMQEIVSLYGILLGQTTAVCVFSNVALCLCLCVCVHVCYIDYMCMLTFWVIFSPLFLHTAICCLFFLKSAAFL